MAVLEAPKLMTTEEFLALPDDGIERMLIRGVVKEGSKVSRRGRNHSRTQGNLSRHLGNWVAGRPAPRGEILDGDAAFRFEADPDTTFGIDIAYISAELAAAFPRDVFVVGGSPVLAVEILSPSDKVEVVADKIKTYLAANIPLIWSVDPIFDTVTVYQPGQNPVLYSKGQFLEGGPHMPGLRVAVDDIFE